MREVNELLSLGGELIIRVRPVLWRQELPGECEEKVLGWEEDNLAPVGLGQPLPRWEKLSGCVFFSAVRGGCGNEGFGAGGKG